MRHWSDAWMNIPHERLNCARLCVAVQGEVFGRAVEIPEEVPDGMRDQDRWLTDLFWHYVQPAAGEPAEGDVALMRCGAKLHHVGTCCRIGRHTYILHAVRSINRSVRTRVADLPRFALQLEGWYAWR